MRLPRAVPDASRRRRDTPRRPRRRAKKLGHLAGVDEAAVANVTGWAAPVIGLRPVGQDREAVVAHSRGSGAWDARDGAMVEHVREEGAHLDARLWGGSAMNDTWHFYEAPQDVPREKLNVWADGRVCLLPGL